MVLQARVSVWIATANVKDLMVPAAPGTMERSKRRYVSILQRLANLSREGVELRMLHASQPSKAFRASLAKQSPLNNGGLQMRMCPRVHLKLIVVDGKKAYWGSANFTGAGLGAKAAGRRNFEMGVVVDDDVLLDVVQARFDAIWAGRSCAGCRLRSVCPEPLDQ
ncbi:MAG: phospholipase [Sorangium cellulosum]|nr:MAG: phospholipase [Sorangium cellulosum]